LWLKGEERKKERKKEERQLCRADYLTVQLLARRGNEDRRKERQ